MSLVHKLKASAVQRTTLAYCDIIHNANSSYTWSQIKHNWDCIPSSEYLKIQYQVILLTGQCPFGVAFGAAKNVSQSHWMGLQRTFTTAITIHVSIRTFHSGQAMCKQKRSLANNLNWNIKNQRAASFPFLLILTAMK